MRRMSMLLCASLMMTSPLLAQKGGNLPDFLSRSKPAAFVPSTPLEDRAFFSLEGELVPPGTRELKIEIRIQGRTALTDILRLPLDAAGGTFEILAGAPKDLADLFAWAKKAGKHAQVVVSLDGRTVRTFTFPEFAVYNQQFHKGLPAVRKPVGETRTVVPEGAAASLSSAGLPTKGWNIQCLDNCDTNRDYCYQTEPSCYGVDYCDVCENQWSSCRNGCWVCEEPKSTSQYTTSWIKSASWAGGNCLYDAFNYQYLYDYYNLVIENDRYQRTEHCDGSHTDTFLYSWDTYGSCTRSSPWTCNYASGSAFPPYCPF